MAVRGDWSDLSTTDFHDLADDTVVVMPIGAVEQHGEHLPLSVDCDLPNAVLARLWAYLPDTLSVLTLPMLAVTKSDEHLNFKGTLSLSANTLLAVLDDLAASVARTGLRRLVLLNGHGGNTALLQVAAREMRIRHGMIVAVSSWSGFADWSSVIASEDYNHDLHAGLAETSAMLAARPELVRMDRADNVRPETADWPEVSPFLGLGRAATPAWIAEDLSATGTAGNAADASAEIGEVLLDSAAKNFAAFLEAFSRFDMRGTP